MVDINVKLDSKIYYLLVLVLVVIIVNGVVYAFNSDFIGGQPSIMGHSSDEVMVKNSSGDSVSLQKAIDEGMIGSGGSGGSGPWICVYYNMHYCDTGYAEGVKIIKSSTDISGVTSPCGAIKVKNINGELWYDSSGTSLCNFNWCHDIVSCVLN